MKLPKINKEQIFFKTIFDGYDYISTNIGFHIVPAILHNQIRHVNYLPVLYDKANDFIEYCRQDNEYITSKNYDVGVYKLSNATDRNNPWHDKEFILFNSTLLEKARKKIWFPDLEFYVCPAYNENNEIEAIGFRIKDKKLVHHAFKWIFTCGNNIIYGKNTVDKEKPCYIVEGFRDYVALNESGINAIGLGSVKISKQQEDYISTLKEPIISFDNDSFGINQTLSYKNNYKIALMTNNYKDPWEAFTHKENISFVNVV